MSAQRNVLETHYTVAEFLALAATDEYHDKRIELWDGRIVEMPPSETPNGKITANLIVLFGIYLRANTIGVVTPPDTGFQIAENKVFQPDVGYISFQRGGKTNDKVFPAAPDLAVEVISPSETLRKINEKARASLRAGTKAVLAVYPAEREIDEMRLDAEGKLVIRTYSDVETLKLEDILPDFQTTLRDVFSVLD